MKMLLFGKCRCLAECGDKTVEIGQGVGLDVKEGDLIKVFPLDCQFLPFCFCVGEKHECIKTITFPSFVMLEASPKQNFVPKFLITKIFKEESAFFIGEPNKFCVCLKNACFDYAIEATDITSFIISEKKNIVLLEGMSGDEDFAVIFHKVSHEFVEISGSVEVTDNKIKAVKNCQTLARHGKLLEWEIGENGLSLVESESVYLAKKPAKVPPFLSHIAFFEAVRENDFNLAKSFLTSELGKRLTPQHITAFFGEFQGIKLIKECGKSKVALINNIEQTAKVFILDFDNGKIADINEEE